MIEAAVLQEEIDAVSVMLYQNREMEALEHIGALMEKLKEITNALLQLNDGTKEQIEAVIARMYQIFFDAYSHKDMLGMADCLQEYASFVLELYQVKC